MKLFSHFKLNIPSKKAAATGIKPYEIWQDRNINDELIYSYRDNTYDLGSYPSNLHYHDYFEVIVIEEGEIKYICDENVYYPKAGDVIMIPPSKFHMSAITGLTTRYKRHVFYFRPNAFSIKGLSVINDYLTEQKEDVHLTFPNIIEKEKLRILLEDLKNCFKNNDEKIINGLAYGYVIQFICLLKLNGKKAQNEGHTLPSNILKLKNYIDENYANINSITQIADEYFYSREHTSRLFKKYFDVTVSDYLTSRRILKSQELISNGKSITESAFLVGYNSLSTFIRAFKEITGFTPSKYRQLLSKQHPD